MSHLRARLLFSCSVLFWFPSFSHAAVVRDAPESGPAPVTVAPSTDKPDAPSASVPAESTETATPAPSAPSNGNADTSDPDDESRLAAEALARRKTVPVTVEDPVMLFPDDDSLAAQFWRRYKRADGLFRDAMTQFDMNVASDQAERSLEWMIKAMIAELRVINENDPAFIKAMDASQKAWEDFYEKEITLRFPTHDMDMGSSTAMVYHNAAIPICMARVRELMPWYMGVDSSGGHWMGIGSLWYDSDIALRKEELHKANRLPLKPEDIGVAADVAYGDEYLKGMEDAASAREAEPKDEPEK